MVMSLIKYVNSIKETSTFITIQWVVCTRKPDFILGGKCFDQSMSRIKLKINKINQILIRLLFFVNSTA